jgi:hypothetical protein
MSTDQDRENPYRAPEVPLHEAPSVATLGIDSEAEFRAFVGPRADYYLRAWQRVLTGEKSRARFNWTAFFFWGWWLPYRKLYGPVSILFGIILAEFAVDWLATGGNPTAIASVIGWAMWFICGFWGNTWYLNLAKRQIAATAVQGLTGQAQLSRLARLGGTSLGAAIGFFFLFVLVTIAVAIVLALISPPPEL